jgi:hypothetical protein
MLYEGLIRKITTTYLYLAVLYYLLPFSPLYLYNLSKEKNTVAFHYIKKEKKDPAFRNVFFKREPPFSKDRSRFDVDCALSVSPSIKCIEFNFSKKYLPYLISHYDLSASLNSNRGPPVRSSTFSNFI